MGDVFLANDERLDREVAVKLLKVIGDTPEQREQYVQRFQQEARTIARLNHPHIVGLFDLGFENDQFYMVMEYVQGRNLQEVIESQTACLPVASVLRIAIQLCEALQCAHENGVIHRDIKPANILISTRHEVKLTDFGIARFNENHDLRLTQVGSMMGSFLYAAPEQLTNAADVDARADIYSVGATLYELLTGHPVYNANNMGKLIQMVFTEEPVPPHIHNTEVSEALSTIILRTLQKHIDQRYPSMVALLQDLYALQGRPTPQPLQELGVVPGSVTPHQDTRTSQLRLSLLKTTQTGVGSILKHLRGNHAWINLLLQQYPAVPHNQTYEQVMQRIKQPDLQGTLFSGVLHLGETFVFVREGQIQGALNTAEALVDDDALARLALTTPLRSTYALGPDLCKTLASFVANSGISIQANLDSAVVNLFPILADLESEIEQFSGYVLIHYFSEGDLATERQGATETHVFFYETGQSKFSFALDKVHQLLSTHMKSQDVLAKGRCLLSIYMPQSQLLDTVIRDFWSMTRLNVDYHDPHEGTLSDLMPLKPGEMSHCLSEAVGNNLRFDLTTHTGEILPAAILDKLREAPEYGIAHWIMSEFFFSLNANQQVSAFKDLYPRLPDINHWTCKQTVMNAHGCPIHYDLIGHRGSDILCLVRVGGGDPVDIELFLEETISVKEQLIQSRNDHLLAAFYVARQALNNQASVVFAKHTQKLGLFQKQKGWVKVQKSGFHFCLTETVAGLPPRLIAPSLLN